MTLSVHHCRWRRGARPPLDAGPPSGHSICDRRLAGEPTDLRSVSGIVTDALSLQARGIIQLGLLLLVATPVARVAFSAFAFAQQRDRTYVMVTLGVLAVLVYSLVGGYL
jgi:uncharacterized membrane protein